MKEDFVIDFMFTDQDLLTLARQGNEFAEDELAKRYSKTVRICARPYFLAGGDSEDLIQEGMLGLLSAIRKYDSSIGASFKTFAEQCIHNRIVSAIESASRQKHIPLNEGLSLEDFEILSKDEALFSRHTEDEVLGKEDLSERLNNGKKLLSKFEKQVLVMYLDGLSYKEIAEQVHKAEKSVDNAVQRIRKKFAQIQ